MQKITKESLLELNRGIEPVALLGDLGCQDIRREGEGVSADCPLKCGGVIEVDASVNFAVCQSESCPAVKRRSLLWIYCKSSGLGLHDGARQLADHLGILLEYEGGQEGMPQVIELVDAPPEIGPVESPHLIREGRQEDDEKALFCPILKDDCLRDRCQLFVVDWMEDKNMYRRNCAISLIAIALTDESAPVLKK